MGWRRPATSWFLVFSLIASAYLCFVHSGDLQFVKQLIPIKRARVMGLGPLEEVLRAPEKLAERALRGPREAVAAMNFDSMTPPQCKRWLENARLTAMLGPCAKTIPSVKSGIRCYVAFASMLVYGCRIVLCFLVVSRTSHASQC